MKKILPLILPFVFTAQCYSQTNLVNNGSFESYTACPTAFSQVDYATGWNKSMTNNPGTSHTEYVNSCNTGNWVGVPANGWGSQNAYDGQGYICQTMKAPTLTQDYRENIYSALTTPMIIGHNYHVSFRVSLGDNCQYTSNNVCIKFSMNSSFPINNSSQVSSGLITDKQGWVLVTGNFTADSNYTRVGIGNFYNDANTLYNQTYPSGSSAYSVYYIDSVNVIDETPKSGIFESSVGLALEVYPNPATSYISISGLNAESNGVFELRGIDGRLVCNWTITTTTMSDLRLDLPSECPKGLYFLIYTADDVQRCQRIVIE